MKKFLIVDKADLSIASRYSAEEVVQYGGPWGSSSFTHTECPAEVATHCEVVALVPASGSVETNDFVAEHYAVTEDAAKKATLVAEQTKAAIMAAIAKSAQVCKDVMEEFKYSNAILGVQADGMKETVLSVTALVLEAAMAGDAELMIARIKAIPLASYDAKYITAPRLLSFVNMTEEKMGWPLSGAL